MGRGAVLAMLLLARSGAATDCSEHGACCFPRGESPPALRATQHEARLAAVRVSGGLARYAVKRAVERRAGELGACAARGTVQFAIAPSGAVLLEGAGCTAEVLRAMVFPASDAVTLVALSFATPTASAP